MKKNFYFLFGPPRVGNTLLGSILNQNNDIALTGNSILPYITNYLEHLKQEEIFKNFPDEKSLNNIIFNIRNNYYFDWKAKYIIERHSLSDSISFNLIKNLYGDKFKSITLVRPLFDIIKSFMFWYKNNKTYLDSMDFKNDYEKIDYLIFQNIRTYREILDVKLITKYKYNLVIEYDHLINNTKEIIDKIYNHLNIPKYEHNLNLIEPFSVNNVIYNDKIYGNNLHLVRNKIEKKFIDIEIPKEIIKKYKSINIYWK